MEKDQIIKVIENFSGVLDEKGKWIGDPVVAPLMARLYRVVSKVFSNLDSEEEYTGKMVGIVQQITGVEIPLEYSLSFWRSETGMKVIEKMNKRLPQLPEVRKIKNNL